MALFQLELSNFVECCRDLCIFEKTTDLLFSFGIFLVNTVEPCYFKLADETQNCQKYWKLEIAIVNEGNESPCEMVWSSK